MAYNPFDYIKQVDDTEAKEIVKQLKEEGKRFIVRTDSYMCFGEDYNEWTEYLVKIELKEWDKKFGVDKTTFTYKCHYSCCRDDAEAFVKVLYNQ